MAAGCDSQLFYETATTTTVNSEDDESLVMMAAIDLAPPPPENPLLQIRELLLRGFCEHRFCEPSSTTTMPQEDDDQREPSSSCSLGAGDDNSLASPQRPSRDDRVLLSRNLDSSSWRSGSSSRHYREQPHVVPAAISLAGFEPIILHPYQNLKKALQHGFCDPIEMFKGELLADDKKRKGSSSLLATVPSSEWDETTTSRATEELSQTEQDEEYDDEQEGVRYLLVVTVPGSGDRRIKIQKTLEIFFCTVLFVFVTLRALHRLDASIEILQVQPKVLSEAAYFAVSSIGDSGSSRCLLSFARSTLST